MEINMLRSRVGGWQAKLRLMSLLALLGIAGLTGGLALAQAPTTPVNPPLQQADNSAASADVVTSGPFAGAAGERFGVREMFVQADLLNSLTATTLFLAASTLPFGIWLTKNFIDGIPIALEEAAWVDGASAWQSLRHLVAPLLAPGLAVVGIFTLVTTWGNFFVPFILLSSPEKMPAAVRVFTFFGQYGSVRYGELAAYSLLYTLPVVALYMAVSRAIGGRFALGGAMKG